MKIKKKALALATLISALIVLSVLGIGGKVVYDLSISPLRHLMDKAEGITFEDSVIERYNLTKSMNQDAINSVNALMYAVNSLAVFNTYPKGTVIDDFYKTGKEFGGVEVAPTEYDMRTIPLKGSVDDSINVIIGKMLECKLIFKDKGEEDTRCFNIVLKNEPAVKEQIIKSITSEDEIKKHLKSFDCTTFCLSSRDKGNCEDKCHDETYDIGGSGWFNYQDFVVDLTGDDIRNNDYSFKICFAEEFWNDDLYFSTEDNKCKAPTTEIAEGYMIEDFSLPQDIKKSDNVLFYGIEEWLNAFGDPQYILYSEQFPKEEAEYWKADAYNVGFLTILGTESLFLGFDLLTLRLGKPALNLLEKIPVVGTLGRKAKDITVGAIKAIFKPLGWGLRGIEGLMKMTGSRIFKRQIAEASLEAEADQIIKNAIRNLNLKDDAVRLVKGRFMVAYEELGKESFDSVGRLTRDGREQLRTKFSKEITQARPLGTREAAILDKLQSSPETIFRLSEDLSESAYKLSFRPLSRETYLAFKQADKTVNYLKVIFLGDMTEKKRTELIIKATTNAESVFKTMKPRDLRAFIANQKEAMTILDKMIDGELADGVVEKEGAQKLKDSMDKILGNVVKERGDLGKLFPTGAKMSGMANSIVKWEAKKAATPRHFVALMAGLYMAKITSQQEKFEAQGTNSIALKTPYKHTAAFTQFPFMISTDKVNEFVATKKEDENITRHFSLVKATLENFGDTGKQGMLPEAGRYFLSLTKDQKAWWWDQDPQRFHLVSPCTADVFIRVSNCRCVISPDHESGKFETLPLTDKSKGHEIFSEDQDGNKIPTGEFTKYYHFDGQNPMIYSLSEAGAVRECYVPGTWSEMFRDISSTSCMQINPIVEGYSSSEYNYCYHGLNPAFEVGKGAITAVEVGLPLLCTVATSGAGVGPCIAGLGFVTGVAGETIKSAWETQHKWPHHD